MLLLPLPFIHETSPLDKKKCVYLFPILMYKIVKFLLNIETDSSKNLFKHKNPQNCFNQYDIVYEINCNCGSSYIGQTFNNLFTHTTTTTLPQQQLKTMMYRDMKIGSSNHVVFFENPKNLACSNYRRKVLLKETSLKKGVLYIFKQFRRVSNQSFG